VIVISLVSLGGKAGEIIPLHQASALDYLALGEVENADVLQKKYVFPNDKDDSFLSFWARVPEKVWVCLEGSFVNPEYKSIDFSAIEPKEIKALELKDDGIPDVDKKWGDKDVDNFICLIKRIKGLRSLIFDGQILDRDILEKMKKEFNKLELNHFAIMNTDNGGSFPDPNYPIGSKEMECLASISSFSSLLSVDFSYNGLDDKAVEFIFASSNFSNIEAFRALGNKLTDVSIFNIAGSQMGKKVKYIDLSMNAYCLTTGITEEGVRVLLGGKVLVKGEEKVNNFNLKHLKLAGNKFTEKLGKVFAENKNPSSLETIDLSGNNLRDNVMKDFSEASNYSSLRFLKVCHNRFTEEKEKKLEDMKKSGKFPKLQEIKTSSSQKPLVFTSILKDHKIISIT
jgi:Leucine-rich repeat (LRR) protein